MTQRRLPRATRAPDLASIPNIKLPLDWSPDQALAVFEIVDLLRDHLWAHYALQIQHAQRLQQSAPEPYVVSTIDDSDVPF
jgi:hypothetical protein